MISDSEEHYRARRRALNIRRANARARLMKGGGGFDASVLTAWYRNTILSGEISSIVDLLNSNPGICTATRRPIGAADGSMIFDADAILIPPIGANNGLVKMAWGFWIEVDNDTVNHYLLRYGPGASNDSAATDSLVVRVTSAEAIDVRIYNDATGLLARSATTPAGAVATTPRYVTIEIDLAAAEADKVVVTVEGALQVMSPANAVGAPNAFPSAMQGAPSDIIVGNRRSNLSTLPFVGRLGMNLHHASGIKIAGATTGIWTPTVRANLRALEPMVA